MQGSGPWTRNTRLESSARNRDGTVRRFFASSVCSKVPWKAKAHASGEGSVDPRWRSGRSPATPDRLRSGNVPHIAPLCNTHVVICPTRLERDARLGTVSVCLQGLCCALGGRDAAAARAGRVAGARPARVLAPEVPPAYPPWGRVGGR